jgi:hypothetical protein
MTRRRAHDQIGLVQEDAGFREAGRPSARVAQCAANAEYECSPIHLGFLCVLLKFRIASRWYAPFRTCPFSDLQLVPYGLCPGVHAGVLRHTGLARIPHALASALWRAPPPGAARQLTPGAEADHMARSDGLTTTGGASAETRRRYGEVASPSRRGRRKDRHTWPPVIMSLPRARTTAVRHVCVGRGIARPQRWPHDDNRPARTPPCPGIHAGPL